MPSEELSARTRAVPHPESAELAARAARLCSSWRRERAWGESIERRARGAMETFCRPLFLWILTDELLEKSRDKFLILGNF